VKDDGALGNRTGNDPCSRPFSQFGHPLCGFFAISRRGTALAIEVRDRTRSSDRSSATRISESREGALAVERSAKADDQQHVRGFQASDEDLDAIRDAVRGIRYGTVLITIQDGVIVQIDRTDRRRMRLRRPDKDPSGPGER
jgi:hypothetical protein